MKERLITKFPDIFKDKLGQENRIEMPPVKLEVDTNGTTPFNCAVAQDVSVNFDQEGRRMIRSMLEAGIIKKVSISTDWCARCYFVNNKKQGKGSSLPCY